MRKILRAALFLLPVLILLPHLVDVPYQPGSSFSDLMVTHFPNGLFVQRTLIQWKTVPLWSPNILSGYPFGANPLSGLYYPPGWLALFFSLPFGFNLMIVLQLIWGGIGMYRLLRLESLSEGSALLGGLVFEALPKLWGHLGAGHITLIYAVAWTPWLLYAERRAFEHAARWKVFPGLILGLITLADVRWAAYGGVFWLLYAVYLWVSAAERWRAPARKMQNIIAQARAWLPARLLNILVAGCIAAPVLIPLVQYTQLSTRSQLTAQESFTLSMPPSQLIGLVYPNIGGVGEWMLYPGAIVLALALYVVTRPRARRRCAFWLVLILATLIFALGSYLPPLEWIAHLPGMDLLRVPPRVLFVTGFCFAVVAAYGMEDLFTLLQRLEPSQRDRSALVLFAFTALIVLFAAAVCLVVNKALVRIQFTWGGLLFLTGAAVILLARALRIRPGVLLVLAISLCLIDLSGVNALSLEFRSLDTVFSAGQEAAVYIRDRGDATPFRVYSPSYSLPQDVAAWYHIELADGVDPLQLNAYVGYMEQATGVVSQGYSVTLPSFKNGKPATDNQSASPDPEKLGLLNVKYLVSAFPLQADGLELLARTGPTWIYQNQRALPRAWVQAADAPPGKKIMSEPALVMQPDFIFARAKGPGMLVLSEIAYPGWQVIIDGRKAPVETIGGLLRGVRLADGDHTVQFQFRPWPVYVGLAVSVLAWFIILSSHLIQYRNQKKRARFEETHG